MKFLVVCLLAIAFLSLITQGGPGKGNGDSQGNGHGNGHDNGHGNGHGNGQDSGQGSGYGNGGSPQQSWWSSGSPVTTTYKSTSASTTSSSPSTTSSCPLNLGQLTNIVNMGQNTICYNYQFTVGQGGLLDLQQFIISLPCTDLCTALSSKLANLSIPLSVTSTLSNVAIPVVGHIGLDQITGACGIIIDTVDLTPSVVSALSTIPLQTCVDLSPATTLLNSLTSGTLGTLNLGNLANLESILNGLYGSVTGNLEALVGSVYCNFNVLVPNLCSLAGLTSLTGLVGL